MNENESDGPSQEQIFLAKEKVDKLLRHISNVQEACLLLAKRLIEKGEINLGIRLVAVGQLHDHSKWFGIEWDYLVEGDWNGEAKLAAIHHARSNMHHPEYWKQDDNESGADNMPRIAIAEMVCDFYARSTEFGTSVWEYVKKQAMPRYEISPQGKVYKQIKEFLDLLLEKPFSQPPTE